MAQRGGMRAAVTALAMLLVVSLSACAALPAVQGDIRAPVLIRGRVVDADRVPITKVGLKLQVYPQTIGMHADDPQPPMVFEATYAANPDGSFEIHLAPTADLARYASENGGFVHFLLSALGPGHDEIMEPLSFRRELGGGTWLDEFLTVELRPLSRF
jgi:hypothetical protein